MPEKPAKRLPGRPKQANTDISIYQTIISTASALFKEHGYEAVSLQQIGKQCGVSKQAIYYHFASKPELFSVAMTTMLQNIRTVTSRLLDDAGQLEQGLVLLAEARLANPHAEMVTMMREAEPFLEKSQLHAIREAEQQIHELLAGHFRLAISRNFLREEDPMFLAESFSTLMLMGNRESTLPKYESPLVLGQKLVALFLQGAKAH
ncbi:TetR family transcriptional regulator [Paenibacillus sp. FSL R7-0273]|uniref:TetR/AcrR family transcriptional regulator n=1 Tax=Paenibacillus sp. FSL R7-0273 TaxID=1536772 RepID=UPI0004F82571|nr:TetR/AcrR family transcriptional regulator [Paenibacillus sp. FSL R7-0273]AIQ47364.1 TetR family transcriptional regulator [Paenibacillus sp. FSL R7-0273]OMF96081.1 TetR family transcriptional regulator [Paenibacillus sp. FSL R7-0273]